VFLFRSGRFTQFYLLHINSYMVVIKLTFINPLIAQTNGNERMRQRLEYARAFLKETCVNELLTLQK